jgi:UDP-N-acetylmuramoyl-L-alanyl-D-glutamate--2,6-diaminopimelate ligase
VLCVYSSGVQSDPAQRPLLGRVVERAAHLGVITDDQPGTRHSLQIAHEIIDGYDRPARAHVLPNRVEAIRWVLSQARPGDAVLIAGKGERRYRIDAHEPQAGNDRSVARQWLYQVGSQIEYEQETPRVIPFAARVPLAN